MHWIRVAALLFFASSAAMVLLFRFVPPPFTPLMALRCLDDLFSGRGPKLDKDWTPLDKMSPRLPEAVVASEDQLFFEHNGFDWEAIRSAFTVNGRGKRKIGASTITQQTAKNLFLWPDRSWTRKALEAYFTLLLELLWSKQRILEVYLNIIETGDGIYGAEAAAQRYFQVSSARVTAQQAALLAAVLPNPRVWSPANPTGYLRRRQTWILRQMDQMGALPLDVSRATAEGKARAANPHHALAPAHRPGPDADSGGSPQQKVKPSSANPDSSEPPFPDTDSDLPKEKTPDAGIAPIPALSTPPADDSPPPPGEDTATPGAR